jgi:hypothetical protein
MELLITAIIIGLVIYGLERNNRHTDPRLTGSNDIHDRDRERMSTELLRRA